SGFLTELGAQLLPLLQLRSHLLDALQRQGTLTARRLLVAEHSTEHPTRERAPRNQPHPIVAAGGQHFELDRANQEVVVALLTDQSERVARPRPFVRLRDMPAGKVAAADIDDLALLHEGVHRLPDL